MKSLLFIGLLIPFLVVSQVKPIPAKPAAKPSTTKPTTAKQSTSVKKPVTSQAKPNPIVKKLTEQAYIEYKTSKDEDCEKLIKQILAIDSKNKDAYSLRANIAMFNQDYETMWDNLNLLYEYYPKEPEVYSQFALAHINYFEFPDSIKGILCRKTIRLAAHISEPYATMGMIAAVSGYYQEALSYFNISLKKQWKDSLSKTMILLPYARCLYAMGETEKALQTVNKMIPNVKGTEKYSALFLRIRYQLDLGQLDVKTDLDTLNSISIDNVEILKLNAEYWGKNNQKDTACKIAKIVKSSEGGDNFDISPFCDDLVTKIDLQSKYKKLVYDLSGLETVLDLNSFNYPNSLGYLWTQTDDKDIETKVNVKMTRFALDSSLFQSYFFNQKQDIVLENTSAYWLSKQQFNDLKTTENTKLGLSNSSLTSYKIVGHQQLEVFDEKDNQFLLDVLLISDGRNVIGYLNDEKNPLIVKVLTDNINLTLISIK
jgi:tetratricopeptide (TPR) repeat protein